MKRREFRRGKTKTEEVRCAWTTRYSAHVEHRVQEDKRSMFKIGCERFSEFASKRGGCRVLSFDARVSKAIRSARTGSSKPERTV